MAPYPNMVKYIMSTPTPIAVGWISSLVRTSAYRVHQDSWLYHTPDIKNTWLQSTPSELARALHSIRGIPTLDHLPPGSALCPARVPRDVQIPEALITHFEDVVRELSALHAQESDHSLHPAVIHGLLALGLHSTAQANRTEHTAHLQSLMVPTAQVYQPTVTWLAWLHPEWFADGPRVEPQARGVVEPANPQVGTLAHIQLAQDKRKISAAHMFTRAKPVTLENALIPAAPAVWRDAADAAWSQPNPPATNTWLLAHGDLSTWWAYMPVGAALYQPFLSDEVVATLFDNHLQSSSPRHFTRMGEGIADIFPLNKDAVLGNYAPLQHALDMSMGYSSLMTLWHHANSEATSFSIPAHWAEERYAQLTLAESLGLIPGYSVYADEKMRGSWNNYAKSGELSTLMPLIAEGVRQHILVQDSPHEVRSDAFTMGLQSEPVHQPPPQPRFSDVGVGVSS